MFLLDLISRKYYHYVPPCPLCGSEVTGRYVKKPSWFIIYEEYDMDYAAKEYLKAGELVRFVDFRPEDRCFCAECGHTWEQHIEPGLYKKETIENEKRKRHIEEEYLKYRREHPKKKKSFFSKIFGFFR